MIALLHTSKIHIDKFENLVREFDKNIVIKHFVNEDLLSFAIENGYADSENFENEISIIREQNPELIVCTCSTYGEECDKSDFVERIDKPVVEYLVENYNKIGLAFTANSTKRVSKELILRIAIEKNKEIEILHCDCSEAWKYYESNDFPNYSKSIAETIKEIENDVDVIFLAQASMENAKNYLLDFSKEIYSSPEFGIKKYLSK